MTEQDETTTAATVAADTTSGSSSSTGPNRSVLRIFHPDPEWSGLTDCQELTFPPLHYRTVSKPFRKPMRQVNPDPWRNEPPEQEADIKLGASYRIFHGTPHFHERIAIFESLLFPYRGLPTKSRFRSAHGVMMFPNLQLHSYTQESDRLQVFISEKRTDPSRLVGRFRFFPDRIELTELDDDDALVESKRPEPPPPLPFVTS